MTKHEKATVIEHLISSFLNIKKLSGSGEIDRLCLDGMNKLYVLAESDKIQKELDEVRKRRIDPTA
jgi:hypothetical protein